MVRRATLLLLGLLIAALSAAAGRAQGIGLTVEGPAALEPVAARVRALDHDRLADRLARAGLLVPPDARITLVPEGDARAQAAPRWVVAQAFGAREIVIFPDRVGPYPYGSLESTVWHEVVHLALVHRAGGRPLPRWFHEGVARTVETGWGAGSQLRLIAAAMGDPSPADLNRLFSAGSQPQSASAYLLAAALVSDIRSRHGAATPGAIAAAVGEGAPFDAAFEAVTGETPAAAADRAWAGYRRWAAWIPVLTDGTALWLGILLLAALAFAASLRRRARQRQRWAAEENDEEEDPAGRLHGPRG